MTANERRYNVIPTGEHKRRKCSVCKEVRTTTNRQVPYICEIDLRTVGRDLMLWRGKHSWLLVGIGFVLGAITGAYIW